MILDEIKILIKDCEKLLIKDARFKKDYKFKSQVKTIYGSSKKATTNQILIPVPYYSGGINSGNETSNQNNNKKCPKCPENKNCPGDKTCPHYDEATLNEFKPESEELHKLANQIRKLDQAYTDQEMSRLGELSETELSQFFSKKQEEYKQLLERLEKNKK